MGGETRTSELPNLQSQPLKITGKKNQTQRTKKINHKTIFF